MQTRTPLFVKPPTLPIHALLLFSIAASPLYIFVFVFLIPSIPKHIAESGLLIIIALSVLSLLWWAAVMGKYLSQRNRRNTIILTILIAASLIFVYLFELLLIANYAINWGAMHR